MSTQTPTFEDYVSARNLAWDQDTAYAVVNSTEFRKEWDDHGTHDEGCPRCRRMFTRIYGDPPVAHPVDRVTRFLEYYRDHDDVILLNVASASTGHKDVPLVLSDLRYLVDFHAARRGLVTPTGK